MKPKKGAKKLRVETAQRSESPEVQEIPAPPSPTGSSCSTASSLLSVGPPLYVVKRKPNTDIYDLPSRSVLVLPDTSDEAETFPETASSSASSSSKLKDTSFEDNASGYSPSASEEARSVVGPIDIPNNPNPTAYPRLPNFKLDDFPKLSYWASGKGELNSDPQSSANTSESTLEADAADNSGMDNLDNIQNELETLWTSIAMQIRILQKEHDIIPSASSQAPCKDQDPKNDDDRKKDDAIVAVSAGDHNPRTSVAAAAQSSSSSASSFVAPNKPVAGGSSSRRAVTTKKEKLPNKKLKGQASGKGKSKKSGEKPAARATQNRSHSVSSDLGNQGMKKHPEMPTRFWNHVENYVGEISLQDIKRLEQVLETQEQLAFDAFEIPLLGKHFRDDEETANRRARESAATSSRDCVGPLTQRLVSALVDERVSMYNSQHHLNSPKEDASVGASQEGCLMHRHGLAKALGLDGESDNPPLENRIRDCLVDEGLLLPDDANDQFLLNPEDEILAEIKRTQHVFKNLQQYNVETVQALLKTAQKEYGSYVFKRQLDKADADVIEAYKAIAACRSKKKPVGQKLKDTAQKALEARQKALDKYESAKVDTSQIYGESVETSPSGSPTPVDDELNVFL